MPRLIRPDGKEYKFMFSTYEDIRYAIAYGVPKELVKDKEKLMVQFKKMDEDDEDDIEKRTLIESIRLPDGKIVWVDEEGLFKHLEVNEEAMDFLSQYGCLAQEIVGNVVIVNPKERMMDLD